MAACGGGGGGIDWRFGSDSTMKLVSWNVNGLRAVWKNGFAAWVAAEEADVIALQEVKARPGDFKGDWPAGYTAWWNSAERPGYRGTLILTKEAPRAVSCGIGVAEGDAEGRVQTAEFEDFFLVNVYTPNARRDLSRLPFRVGVWDPAFRDHLQQLDSRKPVLFCGDLNVAHQEIDIANARGNRGNSGFTDEERAEFTAHLAAGFVDTYRDRHPEYKGGYSWWSYMGRAREKNVGWRIDYFGISARWRERVEDAFIRPEVRGSDHCPVGVVIRR